MSEPLDPPPDFTDEPNPFDDDPGVAPSKPRAPRKPPPPYKWAEYFGFGTPWAWVNLDADEAEDLLERLTVFVDDYNATMVVDADEVIPGCWQLHPPLLNTLPPLFYAWWWTHRVQTRPPMSPEGALNWHERHLPAFQARLDGLLGPGREACRSGRHGQVRDHRATEILDGMALAPPLPAAPAQAPRTFGSD